VSERFLQLGGNILVPIAVPGKAVDERVLGSTTEPACELANCRSGGLGLDGWSKKLKSSSVNASSILAVAVVVLNGVTAAPVDEGLAMGPMSKLKSNPMSFITKSMSFMSMSR
jgi:hypothetical protein